MSKKYFIAIIAAAILCLSFLIPQISMGQTDDTDKEALASRLVNECAGIKEGDLVVVYGGVRDLTLLEDICVNVRKKGAFPLLTIGSDRMSRRMYIDVPVEYDSQLPAFNYEMAKVIDAIISVDFSETEDLLSDIPPERFDTRSAAAAEINNLMMQRNVKTISLGNGLYPTKMLAALFAMNLDDLTKLFWEGVNVDYALLNKNCTSLKNTLSTAKAMHVTNDDGTDFTVQIEGRPIFISDGVISETDFETGGAACQVWLPAGEIYLTPVPGTANGTVVVKRQYFSGKEIDNLKLIFTDGKLTDMSADNNLEVLRKYYDACGGAKDRLGIIDFGMNPNIAISPENKLVCWVAEGMITLGVGNNEWAGGNNETSFFMANFLPGSTVSLDGKVIIDKGKLVD